MPEPWIGGHLAVVSHVVHHRWGGHIHAYTPYARELDLWAGLVDRLTIVAPVEDRPPPADASALVSANVDLVPQRRTGGDSRRAKLAQLLRLPVLAADVASAFRGADAVQVRCPGNLGLIGAVVAPIGHRRVMAKYAGQWRAFDGEPRAWRFQRWLLRSRWFRGPVLVYGPAPTDRAHVLPAFSTAVDATALARAGVVAAARTDHGGPLRVLFVGRLTAAKRADAVIDAVRAVVATGRPVELRIVGDGPAREALGRLAAGLPVVLVGAVEQAAVFDEYAAADVLVLASETEGWPKAIVEAMAFGVVCIGNDGGMVPTILGDGRGSTVRPGDAGAIASRLVVLADDPGARLVQARAAAAWAGRFSLEELGRDVSRLLAVTWRDGSPRWRPPQVRGTDAWRDPTSPPRHVLQVIDSLAAGGAEHVAVHLANELADSGVESSLIATRGGGPLGAAVRGDVWWTTLGRRGRFDLMALWRLRTIIRERRIDVVHAHSTSVFVVLAALFGTRRPAIVWHDHFPAASDRDGRPFRLVARSIDAAVAVSDDIASADRGLGLGDRLEVLPNFAVLDADVEPARDLPGQAGSRVVCVANVRPPKDQISLVRAFAAVHRVRPDAHLLLVGSAEGAYADGVRAEIERLGLTEAVSFVGVRSDVAAVLAAVDVGVLSSAAEGTPLAVLEYGLAGLPVVATAVGEVPAAVAADGWLVAPRDPDALARALLDALDDPAAARARGAALRSRLEATSSSGTVVGRWLEIYERAIARRTGSERRAASSTR